MIKAAGRHLDYDASIDVSAAPSSFELASRDAESKMIRGSCVVPFLTSNSFATVLRMLWVSKPAETWDLASLSQFIQPADGVPGSDTLNI